MRGHLPEATLLEAALERDCPSAAPLDAEIAAHLSSCQGCQARMLALHEDLASIVYRGVPEVPPAELRTRVLSSTTDDGEPFSGLLRRFTRMFETDAAQSRTILTAAHGDSAWELRGAVSYFHFSPGGSLKNRAEAGIVRVAPGASVPSHRHRGEEHGLVLRGTLREDLSGHEAFPGDFVFMPEGSVHTVTCTSKESCVFAVLLYGGHPIFEGL